MSDLGGYPSPESWPQLDPPPPETPRPPSSQGPEIPMWAIYVAAVIAVAMVGVLAFAIVDPFGGSTNTAAAPPPPPSSGPSSRSPLQRPTSYPKHWDKRILPEVRLAEDARLLDFKHPVPVRFLSDAAFTKALLDDDQT